MWTHAKEKGENIMTPKQGDHVVCIVGGQNLKGTVVGDQGELLVITDGKSTMFVNKRQMGAIVVEGAPDTKKEKTAAQTNSADLITVLACANPATGCKGVRYCKAGAGAARNDFEAFMSKCQKRQGNCKATHVGKLSQVPVNELKTMLDSTVFGEYPN